MHLLVRVSCSMRWAEDDVIVVIEVLHYNLEGRMMWSSVLWSSSMKYVEDDVVVRVWGVQYGVRER